MDRKSRVKETVSISEETPSQRIMLEEYRFLYTDYLNLRTEGVNRVNFFITAMSVLLGGVLVIASSSKMPVLYFKLILLAVSLILAIIGIEIYNYLIHRTISSDRRARGLARIRNYFIKLDPDIRDFFVNKIHDTPSTGLVHKQSGLRKTVEAIEGVFIGVIFAISSSFLLSSEVPSVAIGLGMTLLAILVLEANAHRRLNKALKNAIDEMKFSKNDPSK
jgi:hypothetical protein